MKGNKHILRTSIALIALFVLYWGQPKLQNSAIPKTQTPPQLSTSVLKTSAFEHSTGVQLQRPFSTQSSSQSKPEQSFIYHHSKAIFSLCRYGFLQLYNGKIKAYIHFPERIFFCVYRL
ncbi:MAG: hypothetical protein V4538_06630 [Bacteroidota bacterium]